MTRIVCVVNGSIENPNRGTPLRICNILRQMRENNEIIVCASAAGEEFADVFIPYPKGTLFSRIRFFRRLIRERNIDIVFATTETSISIPIVLKFFSKIRIAIDIHGLLPEEIYATGSIGYLRYQYLRAKERFLLRRYDIVFTVSKKLNDYFAPHKSRWYTLYGGIENMSEKAGLRNSFDNGIRIGYMGNTRPYQGLSYILDAAESLRENGVPVLLNLIISGTKSKDEVKELLRARSLLEFTTVHQNVSHEEANRLVLSSDVLVIARPSTSVTEYAFPSKLPEYLATGIPVIVTNVGPIAELGPEIDSSCYIIEKTDISRNLVAAISQIYKMSSDERQKIGEAARIYVEKNFLWSTLGKELNSALN